jgi:phosphatidate cytidylyltransferase
MEERLWITFVFLFSLGGIGVWYLSKRCIKGIKYQMRGKYLVYLLVSLLMFLISIYSSTYSLVCLIICLLGLIEIYTLALPKRTKFISITAFLPLSLFFIYFSHFSALYDATLLLCLVLALDGFGQIIGKAFGKSSIAKNISPNKTWEGFFGGYFCVLLGYLFLKQTETNIVGMFMITILTVAALSGDLLASYLKRKAGVKDFNGLIPFHGGVLDRFDSLIMASAIAGPFYMMGFKI